MRNLLFLLLFLFVSCSSDDDNSNPTAPTKDVKLTFQWQNEVASFLPQGMVYDQQNRPYLFLAAKGGGLLVFKDNGTNAPSQVANVAIGDLKTLHAMNIYQQGNYLYLSLGDFFGENSKAGLAIINVSNPESPVVEDVWDSDAVIEGSAIVHVEGNYAYLGAMKHGLYIFDISNPKQIKELSNYVPDKNFPIDDPPQVQIPNARGMDVVGNFLYLCYDAGGIRIIDISNKEFPDEVGKFANQTNQHNTPKAYNNIIVEGNLAYCAVDYCGLEVWDITNKQDAEMIGWWNPWNCETLENLWFNSPGHSNQMIYDSTNKLMFVSTGRSDFSVLDVSDSENPSLKSSYGVFDDNEATWGMTMQNQDIYLLYIKAGVPLYSDWSGIKKLTWAFED